MKAINWNVEYFVDGYLYQFIHDRTKELTVHAGMKIEKEFFTKIDEVAFTMVFVLLESHVFIHTWPKDNMTYLQLSSYNEEEYRLFMDLIRKYFQVIVEKDNGKIEGRKE